MNMKIVRISLYSKNGERRDVNFNLSGLSVITGGSKTGKSSLLKIVDYCLGSSECSVAHGRIRDTVLWYSITLQLENNQLFIARKAPDNGFKESNEFSVISEEQIELPLLSKIETNTKDKNSILNYLTRLIGMPEQETEVPDNNTRASIKLNFKHSKYLYFQSQGEIANEKLIFHRQDEPFIPQMIKDTLPYFIGAAEDNRFSELEKLRGLRKELSAKNKKLSELQSIKGDGLQKGSLLLNEALSVSLYQGSTFSISDNVLINSLKKILEWIPEKNKYDNEISDSIAILNNQYDELIKEKKIINARIREVETYNQTLSGYESAVSEQKLRLRSIGLFNKLEECKSNNPYISIFKDSLEKLGKELGATQRTKPRLSTVILNLKAKQTELAEHIKNNQTALDVLKKTDQRIATKEKLDLERAKVIGRISLYIDGINWNYDTTSIQEQIRLLKPQIEELEEKLNPDILKERLDAQLNCIGEDMTKWARYLQLEHSDNNQIKLDINKLTVVADTPKGRIPLYLMGSGENWVGYHLVTHLALAKWFKKQNRPVANFLFFDQPTQVYFPSEIAKSGNLSEIPKDEDREAVHRMFYWLDKVCKDKEELGDSYQIIITDHADIDEDWFQEAICDKKWRGEYALIPRDWY